MVWLEVHALTHDSGNEPAALRAGGESKQAHQAHRAHQAHSGRNQGGGREQAGAIRVHSGGTHQKRSCQSTEESGM